MHRQPLLTALAAYGERHLDEAAMTQRFIDFVEGYEDASTARSNGRAMLMARPGSSRRRDAVLLTHHRKLDLWIQLGGHADGNPDPLTSRYVRAWRNGSAEPGAARR